MYFRPVKIAAYIFLSLFTSLNLELILPKQDRFQGIQCCSKKKCAKSEPKPRRSDNCENNRCNPFMFCSYGNFYLLNRGIFIFPSLPIEKCRSAIMNDNRLSTRISECWHPPNYILFTV